MFKRYLCNQKGMALAVVLIFFVVISLLGVAILEASVADTRHAARDEKRMQAFYIAKSGVEATAAWMMTPGNNGTLLLGKTSPETILDGSVEGKFTVEVQPSDPANPTTSPVIRLIGIGNVDGITNKAILVLKKAGSSTGGPFSNLISATNNINYTGTSLLSGGNIAAENNITQSGSGHLVGGTAYPNTTVNAPPIMFPADPSSAPIIEFLGNSSSVFNLDIASDADKMIVTSKLSQNNGTLYINTGTSGETVKLVAKDVKLDNGIIDLTGNGILHLFITNSAEIKSLKVNPSTTADKLIIFLGDGVNFKLAGNDVANMCIYGPGANITVQGCNGFTGAIVGQNVNCAGTSSLTYPFPVSSIDFDDLPVFYYTRGPWENP